MAIGTLLDPAGIMTIEAIACFTEIMAVPTIQIHSERLRRFMNKINKPPSTKAMSSRTPNRHATRSTISPAVRSASRAFSTDWSTRSMTPTRSGEATRS